MTEELKVKLAKLREKYSTGYSDGTQFVDEIESELRRLIEDKRMANNPIFVAIFNDAQRKLNEINALLLSEATTEKERDKFFAEKRVWKFIFDRFGMKPHDDAIKLLEETIDSRLGQ